MPPRRATTLHPALALGAGAALHVLVGALAASIRPAGPIPLRAPSAPEIEVSLWSPPPAEREPPPTAVPGPSASAESRTRARALTGSAPNAVASASEPKPTSGVEILDSAEGADPPLRVAPQPKIDLGLTGSLGRSLLLEGRSKKSAPARRSAGGLAEALDARDAERGLGRAGALASAARFAAGHAAPPFGSAVFEVRADATGRIATVTLLRFGSDADRWQSVSRALRAQLAGHRLRVPKGARGVACLLRIDRGALAREVTARDRAKKSAALGQGSLGTKDVRDESTRASFENGHPSPTLGGNVAGGGSDSATRVVLLGERAL